MRHRPPFATVSVWALVSLAAIVGCGGRVETLEPTGERDGGSGAGGSASEGGIEDGEIPETSVDTAIPDTGPVACGLELISTGTAWSATGPGAMVQGPHVVATPTGFLLAGRAYGGTGGEDRAVLVPMSDQGELGAVREVPGAGSSPCPAEPSRSTAFAWNDVGAFGLVALSTGSCGPPDTPTMRFALVGSDGSVVMDISYDLPGEIRLADKHAAAASGNGGFLLAGSSSAGHWIYTLDGVEVGTELTVIEAFPGATYAMLATTQSVSAALTAGPAPGVTLRTDTPSLSVVTTDPGAIAPFATLAAWDTRTLVVFPTQGGFRFWVDDAVGGEHVDDDVGAPAYASLDAARLGDYVFVAGGSSDTVELLRFSGAAAPSLNLALLMARRLHPSNGVDGLSGFDGTSMTIAAARERVIVTWVAEASVNYALLRCSP